MSRKKPSSPPTPTLLHGDLVIEALETDQPFLTFVNAATGRDPEGRPYRAYASPTELYVARAGLPTLRVTLTALLNAVLRVPV